MNLVAKRLDGVFPGEANAPVSMSARSSRTNRVKLKLQQQSPDPFTSTTTGLPIRVYKKERRFDRFPRDC